MLNAVSATWAILRRPILVAFYDTHGDTEDPMGVFRLISDVKHTQKDTIP